LEFGWVGISKVSANLFSSDFGVFGDDKTDHDNYPHTDEDTNSYGDGFVARIHLKGS